MNLFVVITRQNDLEQRGSGKAVTRLPARADTAARYDNTAQVLIFERDSRELPAALAGPFSGNLHDFLKSTTSQPS